MRLEDEAQIALFEYLKLYEGRCPELALLYHIPNEGKRSPAEGAKLKRMGVKSGVPDLHMPVARGQYHGLYIELKVDNRKPTQNQLKWQKLLREQGYKSEICWEWPSAAKVILDYLK